MLLYTVIKDQRDFGFSAAPDVDRLYCGTVSYLDCALPLEVLHRYLQGMVGSDPDGPQRQITTRIACGLSQDGLVARDKLIWRPALVPEDAERKILEDRDLFARFCRLIEGRVIAEAEYPLFAQELNISAKLVPKLLQKAVNVSKGEWLPALKRTSRTTWRCERCGGSEVKEWPAHFGTAATCEGCKSLGALSSLQVLFVGKSSASQAALSFSTISADSDTMNAEKNYTFSFSEAQRQAAAKLLEYNRLPFREILIWAACGAGKTEICFPLIKQYLQRGYKVLFAAPRQDVVHDVAPRLRRDFPEYRLKVLSGARPPDLDDSPLTVATTHQILRFRQAFDLIIFDEMDAYPFAHNRVLAYGLRQALKDGGKTVYLTATPTAEMFAKVAENSCALVRLPARHHGRPLPVPEIIKVRLPAPDVRPEAAKSKPCSEELSKVFRELAERGPLLVFVPRINLVREWVSRLRALFPDKKVAGSWSADKSRTQKVAAFLAGEIAVFVCTSILERGVTLDNVQVAVLYADHELYDVRALVQMAGRTGRTVQNPDGRALFLATRITKAMKEAVEWVREQNKLALEQGFLKEKE